MTRIIIHEEKGPLKLDKSDIDEEKGDIAICLCGLSEEYPFCDGSHRITEDEKDDILYKYIDDKAKNQRKKVEDIIFSK